MGKELNSDSFTDNSIFMEFPIILSRFKLPTLSLA